MENSPDKPFLVDCDYCGYKGEFGVDIKTNRFGKYACKNVIKCASRSYGDKEEKEGDN